MSELPTDQANAYSANGSLGGHARAAKMRKSERVASAKHAVAVALQRRDACRHRDTGRYVYRQGQRIALSDTVRPLPAEKLNCTYCSRRV